MGLNEQNYERVGRYLDGEPLGLTDDERDAAKELRAGEKRLGAALDADVPREAMQRARKRMMAALADPRVGKGRLRIGHIAGAVANAAAIALVVMAIFHHRNTGNFSELPEVQVQVSLADWVDASETTEPAVLDPVSSPLNLSEMGGDLEDLESLLTGDSDLLDDNLMPNESSG